MVLFAENTIRSSISIESIDNIHTILIICVGIVYYS